ncbi:MAG: Txe/YoeB family addiction module toxin [Rickettsiales bacterium]|jgi:toxin YoeB|nr:Txe/YoeB family addiction module toxin [Rickettsiales bacterium]
MNLSFLPDAWDDYLYWQKTDKKVLKRINELIKATIREPLKFALINCWSRRINSEHRLVYKIEGNNLIILQCRYHY